MHNRMLKATLDYCCLKVKWTERKQIYLQKQGTHTEEDMIKLEGVKQDCFLVISQLLELTLARLLVIEPDFCFI
jgi:hypothetical protein